MTVNRNNEVSSRELAGLVLGAAGGVYVLAFAPLRAALGDGVFPLSTVLACGTGVCGARGPGCPPGR